MKGIAQPSQRPARILWVKLKQSGFLPSKYRRRHLHQAGVGNCHQRNPVKAEIPFRDRYHRAITPFLANPAQAEEFWTS